MKTVNKKTFYPLLVFSEELLWVSLKVVKIPFDFASGGNAFGYALPLQQLTVCLFTVRTGRWNRTLGYRCNWPQWIYFGSALEYHCVWLYFWQSRCRRFLLAWGSHTLTRAIKNFFLKWRINRVHVLVYCHCFRLVYHG